MTLAVGARPCRGTALDEVFCSRPELLDALYCTSALGEELLTFAAADVCCESEVSFVPYVYDRNKPSKEKKFST